jgi:hypothetical protein
VRDLAKGRKVTIRITGRAYPELKHRRLLLRKLVRIDGNDGCLDGDSQMIIFFLMLTSSKKIIIVTITYDQGIIRIIAVRIMNILLVLTSKDTTHLITKPCTGHNPKQLL